MSSPTSNSVTVTTVAKPANAATGSLIDGEKWGGALGTGVTLDYSFMDVGSVFAPGYQSVNAQNVPTAFTPTQQANISDALQAWADVANITFNQVTESATVVGDLRLGLSTIVGPANGGVKGFAYLPTNNVIGGDAFFLPAYFAGNNVDPGSSQYRVILHELGHALGLKHPFEGSPQLPAATNSQAYSVMAYVEKAGAAATVHAERLPTGPMMYDIAAMQYLYGANTTHNVTATNYTYSSTGQYWETIWDAGGNDTITVTGSGDSVINLNQGKWSQIGDDIDFTDGTATKDTIAIAVGAVIENATGGAGNDSLIGNEVDNILDGGAGNDTLDGGAGADTLIGGAGNDVYIIDANDVITEGAAAGVDEVRTALSAYTLGANLDNLTFTPTTGAFAGTGNTLDNLITAAGGNDTLVGAAGNDTLVGAAGNDSLDGGADNDSLQGGLGNDTLDGGIGVDTLDGGAGNDLYVVDNAGDVVAEGAAAGTDTVQTTLASLTLAANVENLAYTGSSNFVGTGNALANSLTGGAGNDTLDGGAGVDTLDGGAGNDIYLVDVAGDVVTEAAAAGTDEIRTALSSYTLGNNIENLTFTGTAGFAGTGNTLDNIITGAGGNDTINGGTGADTLTGAGGDDSLTGGTGANALDGGAGNDTLNGGAGADTMTGGAGNDIYIVDAAGDVVTEASSAGTADEVRTTLASYTLGSDVENLTFNGTGAFAGTGNTLNNIVTGAAGNDTLLGGVGVDTLNGAAGNDSLDGGAGADSMAGGVGNDVYVVDDANDIVTEAASSGTDTIQTALASYTLGTNIENLTYTGSADFTGTGGTDNNVLTGAAGNDSLTGGAGLDTLIGGAGNDTLDGGTGADSMVGGAGDDVFIIDAAGDLATESTGGGTDEARTNLAAYTLTANVENLTFTGTIGFAGTGNTLDNMVVGGAANDSLSGAAGDDSLTGAAGNDTLDGGAGDDTMVGGAGNDVYVVDAATDVVTEGSGDTGDEVRTTLAAYTLGANIENLSFTGTTAFAGTGNTLNNIVTGAAGADTLLGGVGTDSLVGEAGNDSLDGGVGADTPGRWRGQRYLRGRRRQ